MMESQIGGSGIWDYEWNYRDGLLSNNGWTKTISGAASESIDDTGLILRSDLGGDTGSYVRLSNSNFIMPVGVLEVVCTITGTSGSYNLRIGLSNGTNGAQVYENTGFWRVMDSTTVDRGTPVAPFSANQEYTIRLELDNESFSVFVNDALTYEGSASTIVYGAVTHLMSQNQVSGVSIIKSIKIKRNRLV